jgi:hypothetical protein
MKYYLKGNLDEIEYVTNCFEDILLRDIGDYICIDIDKMTYYFTYIGEMEHNIGFISLPELISIIRDKNIDNLLNN